MTDRLAFVSRTATQLMAATPSGATKVSEQTLRSLAKELKANGAFLYHNDHNVKATRLITEWPPRLDASESNPFALVPFTTADPVFADCRHSKKLAVIQAESTKSAYARWIGRTHGVGSLSVVSAPLVSGSLATGILGLVKFGRAKWKSDELNMIEAIASLFAQLQARTVAEEKLRHLADHDDLTGLPNRRALLTHLSDRLVAGETGPVAVLFIDLDRLKAINDYFGHIAGDRFIRDFGSRLRTWMGESGMVARIGGDEFVAVPGRPMLTDEAEMFADRLRNDLRKRVDVRGHTVTSTASVGVTVGYPGKDDAASLVQRADDAVLAAKRGGGNQVVTSTDDMSLKSLFRKNVEIHVVDEIGDESLLLHYQPEVDLWSGAIVGVEALVRWQHPTLGLQLPGSFIDVAESANLASDLGLWVLRRACDEFSSWQSNGVATNATLRINVSPVQLAARGFVRDVTSTIDEFGISANSVCLEITERAVVRDIDSTRRTLAELKEFGVQIAIDDFGTGYAVLSHLKDLPVDALKIDTVFVRDLGVSKGDLAIVRAIIGLANAFDLEVVAEGVETAAAALTLMRHGCHRAQGYLLSRPIPGPRMKSLLESRWMPMPYLADSRALVP